MDMALSTCVEHTKAIHKRELACGKLVGLIPMGQLKDTRGWWRLMELACMQDPHDEYFSTQACRENVAKLDDKIAMAKNLV